MHLALARKPSGCVLWIRFDAKTLDFGPFLFLGGEAGTPLPSLDGYKVARHTKADMQGIKAEKPDHRIVPKARFRVLASAEDVFRELFGPAPEHAANQPRPTAQSALPTMSKWQRVTTSSGLNPG